MKKFITLFVALFSLVSSNASVTEPTAQWAKTFGGLAPSMGNDIFKFGDNLYFFANAGTSVGDGGTGFVKDYVDPNAAIYYGSDSICYGAPYQGASYNLNFNLTKTDLNGNHVWTIFSTRGEIASNTGGIATAPDGGIYVSMKLRHTDNLRTEPISFTDATGKVTTIDWKRPSNSDYRYYRGAIMKVSAAGSIEWIRMIDASTAPQPQASSSYTDATTDCIFLYSILSDADGNIYLSGRYDNPLTFYKADGSTVILTPHNTAGWSGDSQTTVGDMFVAKFDKDGYYTSSLTSTGTANAESQATISWAGDDMILNASIQGLAAGGSIEVDGNKVSFTNDLSGMYVARISKDFKVKWQRYFPGSTIQTKSPVYQYLHVDKIGDNLWLSGMGNFALNSDDGTKSFATTTSGVREGYLIKLDANDGHWIDAVTTKSQFSDITGIVGLFGVFEDNDSSCYSVGYNMSSKGVILFKFNKESLTGTSYQSLISGGSQPIVQKMIVDADNLYTISRGRVYSTMPSTKFVFAGNSTLEANPISQQFTVLITGFKLPFNIKTDTQELVGDVNGDGKVDVSDVTALTAVILTGVGKTNACDIDSNGEINVSDVTALITIILN